MTYTRPVFYYACGTTYMFKLFDIPLVNMFPEGDVDVVIQALNGMTVLWKGGALVNDPFPLMLDPTLWEYRRIPYPASALDMGDSIYIGRDWVINDILTNTAPGTSIALGGYSQGAACAGAIYDSFRQGALADHRHRLKAMVTFGSPVRETNHTYPGSSGYSGAFDIPNSTRGSHGCFPKRLQNTEDFVWDFTMPNEQISGVGDSNEGLSFVREAGLLLFGNILGAGLALADLLLSSLIGLFTPGAGIIAKLIATADITGHTKYPYFPPPNADGSIPPTGDTCYQIAAKYLNQVGQQIYDQVNPSLPNPANPPVYSWSTTW